MIGIGLESDISGAWPLQLAPEIYSTAQNKQTQTEKVDIWSAGTMLYILLTGV